MPQIEVDRLSTRVIISYQIGEGPYLPTDQTNVFLLMVSSQSLLQLILSVFKGL
jgi:hypothetical protein